MRWEVREVSLTLILPWFPIVLAVGVGSRLLDRARGIGFGLLGALFWVVLVLAATGPAVFTQAGLVLSLVSGSLAIIAVSAWSGERAADLRPRRPRGGKSPAQRSRDEAETSSRHALTAEVLERFDDWLEVHRHAPDPWPEFGEFLCWVLHRLCGATHVRPYRALSEGDQLVPLRAIEPGDTPDILSARRGIAGHVATSGVSYVAGDPSHGALVDDLAEDSGADLAWCFAIKQGGRKIGIVKVGQLNSAARSDPPDRALLAVAESLTCQFWTMLGEVCRSRAAERRDPASGLLNRESFLAEADRVLAAAYAQQEPVIAAVITLEGMRTLADRGDWDLADALAENASRLLIERIRADDCLGRFDDSRFVLLLRRVDSALGSLIVDQLWSRLAELCGNESRWRAKTLVRCGVAGSGNEQPTLAELISRAIAECHEARRSVVPISCDLEPPPAEVPSALRNTEATSRGPESASTDGREVRGPVPDAEWVES